MEENSLTLRDHLAIERTKLANERTFLAYFRTAIGMLASGVAIIGLEFFHEIKYVGYGLIIIAPLMFLVGLMRTLYVKKKIRSYYNN